MPQISKDNFMTSQNNNNIKNNNNSSEIIIYEGADYFKYKCKKLRDLPDIVN